MRTNDPTRTEDDQIRDGPGGSGNQLASNRRRFLRGVGATGIATLSAGCLGGDGGGDVTDDTDDTDDGPGESPSASPTFEVSDVDPETATIDEGRSLAVTATVSNTGGEAGSQEIELVIDADSLDGERLSLDPGESGTVSLSATGLPEFDPGEYDYVVLTEDDSRAGTLTIEASLDVPFRRHELAADGLGNAQTDTPPFCPRLKTHDGRQYYAYWSHDGEMVVASRSLPDGEWVQNRTDIDIGNRDGHWTPALGIGPDGHVFICYNTRGSQPTWRRSETPADVTAFGPERNGMTGRNEDGANYPEFTRLDDGTLLFGYRQGSSGNGDWMLNRWNGDAGAWEPLQHPLIQGAFEGDTYNAYPWNLVQSDDGVLHYVFCWRGTGGVRTNQQLSYARSPDGGETWTKSAGNRAYARPITKGTAEVVDPIEPNSNLINQGWVSFHPGTNEPHVAYYRDDAAGNTQIFHAYRSDGDWEREAATDRESNIDLGGPGVVASPIGRMGIVVGEEGDVHVLTRDFQRGSWPLLVEKLDGEWQTSVLYKRNVTWSDFQIDPERWRRDRVLSFVDHQQTIGDVPWSADALVGVSDVDPARLDRAERTVDSWETDGELATYATATPTGAGLATTSTSFEDTSAALAFTETTVPASPMYARATAGAGTTADAEIRVKVEGGHGTTLGDPAAGDGAEAVTTGWTQVPQAFRAGFANVQIRSGGSDAATVSDATLELGYEDPTASGQSVVPRGSDEAASKPVVHMATVDATGLRGEAPLSNGTSEFLDSPTSLDIEGATAETPLFGRVTARMEPAGSGSASIRLKRSGNGEVSTTDPVTSAGLGVRTTGWEHVPSAFDGGTVTLQTASARVTAATLELAVRNDV
jgi:hypothetical protein